MLYYEVTIWEKESDFIDPYKYWVYGSWEEAKKDALNMMSYGYLVEIKIINKGK